MPFLITARIRTSAPPFPPPPNEAFKNDDALFALTAITNLHVGSETQITQIEHSGECCTTFEQSNDGTVQIIRVVKSNAAVRSVMPFENSKTVAKC